MTENEVTTIAAATIRGDSLKHRVRFDGDAKLNEIAKEGTVQLRFTVGDGGTLYSFAVGGS